MSVGKGWRWCAGVVVCLAMVGCDPAAAPPTARATRAPIDPTTVTPRPAPPAAGRIAFARRLGALNPDALPGGIFTVRADGSGLMRITTDNRDLAPEWSPDGGRIAFQRRSWRRAETYVVSAHGGRARRLTDNALPDRSPDWSPDGTRLLVLRDSKRPGAGIFAISARDGSEDRLTDMRLIEKAPEWSPDGSSVLFGDRYGDTLRVLRLSSGRITPVAQAFFETTPEWSPVGDVIAFLGDHRDIWLTHPDGSGRRRLRSLGAEVLTFSWSPEGDRIAYVAQPPSEDLANPGPLELRVITVAKGQEVTVVPTVSSARSTPMLGYSYPVWSPDGTQLAYSGWENKEKLAWSLYRVAADGLWGPVVIPHTRAALMPDWTS